VAAAHSAVEHSHPDHVESTVNDITTVTRFVSADYRGNDVQAALFARHGRADDARAIEVREAHNRLVRAAAPLNLATDGQLDTAVRHAEAYIEHLQTQLIQAKSDLNAQATIIAAVRDVRIRAHATGWAAPAAAFSMKYQLGRALGLETDEEFRTDPRTVAYPALIGTPNV
jgi:hypothetical protein